MSDHRGSWTNSLRAAQALPAAVLAVSLLVACGSESLTVVSWGGVYADACKNAVFDPFTAETGIELRLESYSGGLAQIRSQVETGNVLWDVVDLESADLVKGCEEGLFEFVDIDELPDSPEGIPARADYYEGTYSDCGAGGIHSSTIYAYNHESLSGERPVTIEDFFDLRRFPGRRGMRRSPVANLEMALMADGVRPNEVFAVLSRPGGVDRAFRKLSRIKDRVVWWEAASQPVQMLANQEVVMSTAYNGRIFNAQVVGQQPLTIVWDGQVLDYSQFGVVAGTPNLDAAREFVQFVSRVETIAEIGRYIPYSPTRWSGIDLISTHYGTGIEMRLHMPSAPENLARALRNDPRWWTDHLGEMNERFSAWLTR